MQDFPHFCLCLSSSNVLRNMYFSKRVTEKNPYTIGQCTFVWNFHEFQSLVNFMFIALDKTDNVVVIKRDFCVGFDYCGSKAYLQVAESNVSQPEQKGC